MSRYPMEDAAVIELPALSKWEAWLAWGSVPGAVKGMMEVQRQGRV